MTSTERQDVASCCTLVWPQAQAGTQCVTRTHNWSHYLAHPPHPLPSPTQRILMKFSTEGYQLTHNSHSSPNTIPMFKSREWRGM
jgi:hypothetical protein